MSTKMKKSLCNLCGSLCLCGELSSKKIYHRDTENHRGYTEKILRLIPTVITIMLFALAAQAQPRVTIDHNNNKTATAEYKFSRVPSPARSDAGAKALLTLVDAEADGNSGDISALND